MKGTGSFESVSNKGLENLFAFESNGGGLFNCVCMCMRRMTLPMDGGLLDKIAEPLLCPTMRRCLLSNSKECLRQSVAQDFSSVLCFRGSSKMPSVLSQKRPGGF